MFVECCRNHVHLFACNFERHNKFASPSGSSRRLLPGVLEDKHAAQSTFHFHHSWRGLSFHIASQNSLHYAVKLLRSFPNFEVGKYFALASCESSRLTCGTNLNFIFLNITDTRTMLAVYHIVESESNSQLRTPHETHK